MKTVIDYLNASEDFERSPSERSKRRVRRELRTIIALAKTRQIEVRDTYKVVLEDIRASGKWDMNRGKNLHSKKKRNQASDNT
jgi:hypothetical protein